MEWIKMKTISPVPCAGHGPVPGCLRKQYKTASLGVCCRGRSGDKCEGLVTSGETALSLWTENAPAREKLISCAEVVTQEGGADYIPPEDRIAVFDLDGTLFCETDPKYVDYCLLEYRVL